MKLTVTRPDGTVEAYEGTPDEVATAARSLAQARPGFFLTGLKPDSTLQFQPSAEYLLQDPCVLDRWVREHPGETAVGVYCSCRRCAHHRAAPTGYGGFQLTAGPYYGNG